MKAADILNKLVFCKDCINFMKFTLDARDKTEADGECYIRKICSIDPQYPLVDGYDFCSNGRRERN